MAEKNIKPNAKTDENINIPKKNSSRGSLAVKIMCVFAAFCLWIYVMKVESPEYEQTFNNVTVDLLNTEALSENGLMLYSGYGNMVGVTLSGKKSVVSKLTESDLVVTADVGKISGESGRYDCKINVDVPAGCKLVGTSQETISVYLDSAHQTSVKLSEKRENTNLPEGCYTGAVDMSVDMVTVEGPEKLVSRIHEARFDNDLSSITSSAVLTQKIYLVDSYGNKIDNPYIKYYPEEVTVTIPVLKSVDIPVEVAFKNEFLNLENTITTVTPGTIRATGDPEVIDSGKIIDVIEIDEVVDYISPTRDELICEKVVPLKAAEGVELSQDFVNVTSQLTNQVKSRKITVSGQNIVDTGGKDGVSYVWDKSPVTIRVIGNLEAVTSINADDITLKLDMSPYSETNTGQIQVRAEVEIDSEYKDQLLPVGIYEVGVTFTN